MRLSWNEVRARAGAFAEEWHDASYERGETQSFYNAFFDVFGINRRRVATFEEPVKKLGERQGFIDLFWKGVLLVEQKSAGLSLERAREQAVDYFPGLKQAELPRYVLLCDFQTFHLIDLESGDEAHFRLHELPDYVERFGFILGVERRVFRDQDPANIDAAELMGALHDALKESGYDGHPLERFLVRVLFCLFADGTGIFERGTLEDYLTNRTREDGSDVGAMLESLFQVLNTPEGKRQTTLDEDLAQFPYINGELFAEQLPFPAFNAVMRDRLLEACAFTWEKISPAIFGALFQSVMTPKQRRAQGAHYTTEKNILKVIEPLFMDDLRAEFERAKSLKQKTMRTARLSAIAASLTQLTFLDPACGCGNFLVIAYRELRELELDVLRALHTSEELHLDAGDIAGLSRIDVDQFYGIEIDEFPALIAQVAMWMMDHIMNNRLSLQFGTVFARIPLKASPHVTRGDALEIEWSDVLAPDRCSFIMGNPPFVGAKMQSESQRGQVRSIANLGGSGGTLDYVAAWFLKAGEYLQRSNARIGFVATNSITQGEQVAQLWPLLFDRYGLEIAFAHRTFAWGSDARGKAHVHVVIIGLARRGKEPAEKRLFAYEDGTGIATEVRYRVLSPYLFDASTLANPHLVVQESPHALGGAPKIVIGTKPIDGGYYIFDADERAGFLRIERDAEPLLRPFVGSEEYLNGSERWILVLDGVPPERLRELPEVYKRVQLVRRYRLGEVAAKNRAAEATKQPGISSRQLADTPTRFHVTVLPTEPFLCVPEVSSERRDYIPIGWLEPPTVPSNKLRAILHAEPWQFGILTSRMHMAWTKFVGGRLESRYQYSIGINYNPFPWPVITDGGRAKLNKLAQSVLDARLGHRQSTLADLYDPVAMPPDLRKAHTALDRAVDTLYRPLPFDSDRSRVEHLFGLYETMTQGLFATPARRRPRARR